MSVQARVDSVQQIEAGLRLPQGRRFAKQVMDIVGSLLLLLLLLPLLALIALAVKLTSRGPVLFVQDRVGKDGEHFPFLKFRTMVQGAHLERNEVLGAPDAEMSERYRQDPRVTRVGAILRRWSVDELPQLVNVLVGHMSLVGPRPLLTEEMSLLEPEHHERHDAKPGLTGLWQISGRKETSWEERMDLDLEYVRTVSASNDLAILAKTAKVVVTGQGAY
ncbi:MAG: sugar transferase [Actinomycetia bacterium]|nr:sugar transferase [Actinomycetes bacterium]